MKEQGREKILMNKKLIEKYNFIKKLFDYNFLISQKKIVKKKKNNKSN